MEFGCYLWKMSALPLPRRRTPLELIYLYVLQEGYSPVAWHSDKENEYLLVVVDPLRNHNKLFLLTPEHILEL
jgi:hypothetical protein